MKDDYPPTEFKVPDACITRPNSSVPNTGAYFKDAQFHQSLSDNVAERALSQLMRMGFSRRDAAVDNGDVVDGSETAVYKTTSLDVLWKSSATKEFFMTKFQQVGENRCMSMWSRGCSASLTHYFPSSQAYAFVSSAEQRIKPIALTFMHPVGFADFRVRLIVRSQKDASDASPHIQELAECMCITDDPISHVEIAYPDSLGVTHERIRMRKKKKLMLDGMKATLEQLTDIQTVYLPAATSSDDVDSVEEDSRSGDGDVLPMPSIRRSHELRFKSERLERLIEKYVRNYDSLMTDGRTKTALDHVKQSGHGEEDDDLTADLDETTEFDSAATHADLRSSLEQEIGKLLVFGDQFTSQLEWDFGEQAAAEQEDSDGASFDLNV